MGQSSKTYLQRSSSIRTVISSFWVYTLQIAGKHDKNRGFECKVDVNLSLKNLHLRCKFNPSKLTRILQIKYKLTTSCSLSIIITRQRELAAKITHCIFVEVGSKLQFNGTSSFGIAQVPDATTYSSINHRSNLVLMPPYQIEVSHNIQSSVPR